MKAHILDKQGRVLGNTEVKDDTGVLITGNFVAGTLRFFVLDQSGYGKTRVPVFVEVDALWVDL